MKFNESYIPGLAKSAPVENLATAAAERVAKTARSTAPVDTGEYRNSIRVEIQQTPHRVIAKVIADSDHAMLVESKHGTLSRALRSAGNG